MQTSALPDLAHTATKPVHWLATAAAMAGVVAAAGLLQPGTATATATAPEQRPTTQQGAPPAAPDPARVEFPWSAAGPGPRWPSRRPETSTATGGRKPSPWCTATRARGPRRAASTS
ncbi:hypothetical protein Smic_12890 [Streptomyces microflavus]|uniref:Uncharacterized protein n=1 Tax=Streptomyces microflavus TaxID=1919 RepID=A0A7J0CJS5_STRMI|nr:hypothetical protein Smic_12890 [Streptomyces microflavus]